VDFERELMIRDLSVVEDPDRSPEPCDYQGSALGTPYQQPAHAFHELERRADDLIGLVTAGFSAPSAPSRVH
jgi:hypothetical protein